MQNNSQNVVRLGGMKEGLVIVVKHKDDGGQKLMHALANIQHNIHIPYWKSHNFGFWRESSKYSVRTNLLYVW